MLLWALSPTGGQASLRLLSITTKDFNSTSKVASMNTGNQSSMLFDDLQTILDYGQVDSIYAAALLASPSIKESPQDLWNNVKIPRMASLNTSSVDANGWLSVPTQNVTYSSLLGYPFAGVASSGSSSFHFNSYYYNIVCQKLWKIQLSNSSNGTIPDWYTSLGLSSFNSKVSLALCLSVLFDMLFSANRPRPSCNFLDLGADIVALQLNSTTIFEPIAQSFATTYSSMFIGRYLPNSTSTSDPLFTRFPSIFLGSQYTSGEDDDSTGVSLANCTMNPVFVESLVSCKGKTCGVTKMRPAPAFSNSSGFWNSDLMSSSNLEYFDMFSQELAFAIPGYYAEGYQSTPTEVYLSGEESYSFGALPFGGQVRLYKSVSATVCYLFLY